MKFIACHLGLGDAIICAGLVNFLSKKEEIIIPCRQNYYRNLTSFFKGNRNVTVAIVEGDKEIENLAAHYDSIRVGQFIHNRTENKGHLHFSELFYSDAGVEYNERYDSCPLAEAALLVPQVKGKDVFVSSIGSQGMFNLKEEYLPDEFTVPSMGHEVLAYADCIKNAKEIHCIESAFLQLCEQLPTSGKLFYHKYARPNSNPMNFRKNWIILD